MVAPYTYTLATTELCRLLTPQALVDQRGQFFPPSRHRGRERRLGYCVPAEKRTQLNNNTKPTRPGPS